MNNAPANIKIGGGVSYSTIDPVVLVLLILALALIFLLPRRSIIVPVLFFTFLTPFGQQIYVAGVHLFATRIIILCCWIRISLIRRSEPEVFPGGFNGVDKAFTWWVVFSVAAILLTFREMQAVINQCGFIWDAVGGYFLLRFLIRDEEDIVRVTKTFAAIACVLAVTMLIEKERAVNVFGFIGGRLAPFVRDGVIRSQATFQGPIPAGTFATPLLCLFAWLLWSGKAKGFGIAGLIGGTVMVWTSASSTPLLGFLGAIIGLLMWPARGRMRAVRWGIVLTLLAVQLVMKAPVWFLINHVDLVAGNSGYHRAVLIDACVKHFWDWWLIGVKSTDEWGWDLWDQANQFVAVAEGGGLAALIFFIAMISRCFGRLGNSRKSAAGDRDRERFLWVLGAALFTHIVAFFGISYNDQTTTSWFALLVMISAATASVAAVKKAAPDPAPTLSLAEAWLAHQSLPGPELAIHGERNLRRTL
jgi:hypothetical protein